MRNRWRSILFAVLLTVILVSASATATVYEYGDYIWAEGTLDSDGNWAEYTATVGAYSQYYPCDFDLTAGLYKGDQFVSEHNTGVVPDRSAPISYPHDDTSAYSGAWQGYGWHWGSSEYLWEDSLTTYDPPLDKSFSAGLAAIHPLALVRAVDDEENWIYCLDMNPSGATEMLGKTKAVKLDVLYRRTLFGDHMKAGDYCPFILVNRDGDHAKIVFPKPDQSLVVVSVEWRESGWTVLSTDSLR